jgi:hypothetical protein
MTSTGLDWDEVRSSFQRAFVPSTGQLVGTVRACGGCWEASYLDKPIGLYRTDEQAKAAIQRAHDREGLENAE